MLLFFVVELSSINLEFEFQTSPSWSLSGLSVVAFSSTLPSEKIINNE
jgi:hypothetical protein